MPGRSLTVPERPEWKPRLRQTARRVAAVRIDHQTTHERALRIQVGRNQSRAVSPQSTTYQHTFIINNHQCYVNCIPPGAMPTARLSSPKSALRETVREFKSEKTVAAEDSASKDLRQTGESRREYLNPCIYKCFQSFEFPDTLAALRGHVFLLATLEAKRIARHGAGCRQSELWLGHSATDSQTCPRRAEVSRVVGRAPGEVWIFALPGLDQFDGTVSVGSHPRL